MLKNIEKKSYGLGTRMIGSSVTIEDEEFTSVMAESTEVSTGAGVSVTVSCTTIVWL